MRPTRLVTTVLLIAAIGAAGCVKHRDNKKAKSIAPVAEQAKPAGTTATPAEETRAGIAFAAGPHITPAASFADGEAAYRAKSYKEATAIFEAYIERKPGNGWGYYMLGLSAWKSGDPSKAEKAFNQALSIDPNHVKSLVNSGRLFIEQQRPEDAIDRFTKAADIDPDSPEVHRLLARTYRDIGRTDEAVESYRHAIDLSDSDASTKNDLGTLLIETGHPDEAVEVLISAVELRHNSADFHNNLGLALEQSGQLDAATEAYTGTLSVDPRNEKAKQSLARVQAAKGGMENK